MQEKKWEKNDNELKGNLCKKGESNEQERMKGKKLRTSDEKST